jgi:hypothetical protein
MTANANIYLARLTSGAPVLSPILTLIEKQPRYNAPCYRSGSSKHGKINLIREKWTLGL